jgi:hypothetical protein
VCVHAGLDNTQADNAEEQIKALKERDLKNEILFQDQNCHRITAL